MRHALQPVLLALALSGCITTSSGGFNAQESEEQALEDYLQLSVGYLERGDLASTRRNLDQALAIDPNNSEAYGIWGLVYSREGDTELADQSFRRAIRLDRDNSQARNNYAAFLFAQGRYEAAYEQLERVVRDTGYRARSQAFENLGLAALRLERYDDAEYAFGRAVQLNSNLYRSSLELADLNLRKDDILQARAYYRNYATVRQYFNISPSPRSLWIGIRLERALGNDANVREYAAALENLYEKSPEYERYQQSLNDE